VAIDEARNAAATADADISAPSAAVRTLVIAAREDVEIARPVRAVLALASAGRDLCGTARAEGPLSPRRRAGLTARMFVGDEVVLDVSFAVARARLADITGSDLLRSASEDAYGAGITGLAQVGALGLGKLVRVHVRPLAQTGGHAGLAIRWEATGPGGGLFPALDADITLVRAGQTTLLVLAGVYRPPLGPLGAALDRAALHRVAAATIRNFLGRLAASVTGPAGAPEAGTSAAPLPCMPEMP
jgi:hypothetical protein